MRQIFSRGCPLRHTLHRAAALLVVAGAIALGAGCSNPLAPEDTAVFTISGTATHVDVAYGSGPLAPVFHGATLPFSQTLTKLITREFVYITAQIDTSGDTGTITVTITKGGKTLYQASATGYPNVATASGAF